jgi:hypothetical protein
MIRDEIRIALPDYNLKIMDSVSELTTSVKEQALRVTNGLQETMESKFGRVDELFLKMDVRLVEDSRKFNESLRATEEQFNTQVRELNELVELRYQKKQKTKVDFLLEIKNMHAQMRIYGERIKETKEVTDVIIELYHFIKMLECDVIKANQQLQFSH